MQFLYRKIPKGFDFWITILSLSFIIRNIFINKDEILSIAIDKNQYFYLLLSLLITTISRFINAASWAEIFLTLDLNLSRRQLIEIHINSNIKKYIPGNIWHFVDRIRILQKIIDPSQVLLPVIFEPILMLISGLIFIPIYQFKIYKVLFFIPLIFISTKTNKRIIDKLKTSLLKKIIKFVPTLDSNLFKTSPDKYRNILFINPLLIEILFIFFRFIGFYICFIAFLDNPEFGFFKVFSYFSFAWVAGLVIPGAPGGVGVFESLILILFNNQFFNSELLIILLFYRFTATVSDLLAPILVLITSRIRLN